MTTPGHPDDRGILEPDVGPTSLSGHPIIAGQRPDPLPSERLAGSGVAAWIIEPAALDHLPVLTERPHATTPSQQRTPREPAELPAERRWRPDGGTWPQEGITLTYGELRRLIALHLAQCAATMPRDRPWLFAEAAAKAMADGETPLRLREVLE